MKTIPLTQGQFTIVDNENYKELSKFKWYALKTNCGDYVAVRAVYEPKHCTIYMHRQIMNCPKGMQVDHRFHNQLDNRKSKLRICTNTQNLYNSKSRKGTSQFKGVSWHRLSGKWRAQISINGQQTYLGLFDNEIETAKAYDKVAKMFFGEFARTNF